MDEILQRDDAFIARLMAAIDDGKPVEWARFARLTGTPEPAINKAWKAGQLPNVPPMCIPIREGVVALVSLGACRKAGAVPQFLRDADARARAALGLPPREDVAMDAEKTASVVEALKVKYLAAKTAASKAQSEKLKLETDIKQGKYVLRAEVELDAATCATQVSSALMQLPARLAGMCAEQPAEEVLRIVRDEVRQIVDVIQKATFTGEWGDV